MRFKNIILIFPLFIPFLSVTIVFFPDILPFVDIFILLFKLSLIVYKKIVTQAALRTRSSNVLWMITKGNMEIVLILS